MESGGFPRFCNPPADAILVCTNWGGWGEVTIFVTTQTDGGATSTMDPLGVEYHVGLCVKIVGRGGSVEREGLAWDFQAHQEAASGHL